MVYTANWGIICHLPPFRGTRNNHWLICFPPFFGGRAFCYKKHLAKLSVLKPENPPTKPPVRGDVMCFVDVILHKSRKLNWEMFSGFGVSPILKYTSCMIGSTIFDVLKHRCWLKMDVYIIYNVNKYIYIYTNSKYLSPKTIWSNWIFQYPDQRDVPIDLTILNWSAILQIDEVVLLDLSMWQSRVKTREKTSGLDLFCQFS